jgi:hypothetical protein
MHHSVAFEISIFVFFLVGSGFNVWRHAASVVNSELNGITTYGKFWTQNGAVQAFKTFGALCFLVWWASNDPAVMNLATSLWPSSLGVAPGWLLSILAVTPATAGAFGLFWDVLADIAVVYLKKKFPGIAPEVFPTPATVVTKALDNQPAPVAPKGH